MSAELSTASRSLPVLEQVRFAEFLLERKLISDEQWLDALASHWSSPVRKRIGATIVERGHLAASVVEMQARVFHDDEVADGELDIVEVLPRTEKTTVPMPIANRRSGTDSLNN